ncbi:MAG: hypothetical protein ABIH37_04320 [archaeon]
MNTISRTITGWAMIIVGAVLIIAGFFVIIPLFYGIPILILGFFVLFNKKEDDIEEIKTKRSGGKK